MDTDFFYRYLKKGRFPLLINEILANHRSGGRSYYHVIRANREKYRALRENKLCDFGVHIRTWKVLFIKIIKIAGSRIKHLLGLSQGPDQKNY